MIITQDVKPIFEKHHKHFHHLIPFIKGKDIITPLDLSSTNTGFSEYIYKSPDRFALFIKDEKKKTGASYLAGGYKEVRDMYLRSPIFNTNEEPRNLHLGIDIWGDAGTKIYAPLGGIIHGIAFNNNFGDYGATIILQHQLDTINFYSLYGHLSLADMENKRKGQFITRGENFAHLGKEEENGNWPPHLHFQLILDIGIHEDDYPGVCKLSEAGKYLVNSPDPDLLLNWE